MAKYLGPHQIGTCQRSGQKMLRKNMVEDGQVKGLLVHPDWWEPYHPQLVPPPMRADGLPKQRPAPDEVSPPTASVISGILDAGFPVLTWTEANSAASYIKYYQMYRNVDGGLYSLLTTLNVTLVENFDLDGQFWQEYVVYGSPYTDTDTTAAHTYGYYVIAVAAEGGTSRSNTVFVTT